MENTETNVNKNEESSNFKKLHALVDDGAFSTLYKRVEEIRKRAEKLYNQERSRYLAMRDERLRAEEAERQEQEMLRRAEEQRAVADSAPVEAQTVADVADTVESVDSGAPAAEVPTVESNSVTESGVQQASANNTAAPESVTRTAIPSYIRGVVKHTVRPTETKPRQDTRRDKPTGARPASGNAQRSSQSGGMSRGPIIAPKFEVPTTSRKRGEQAKKQQNVKSDDKRQMNKRMLIRKGYIQENISEERMGTRKLKNKKVNKVLPFTPIKIENAVITTENLTVKILSEKIGKTAQEIIKQLMELGIMTTINSVVDFPTMQLVADALGVNIELKLEKTKEEELKELHAEPDPEESLVKRPPIITVMGHVDHGKTSLLDAIRKTAVAKGEAGGITQHIGAYSVDVNNEKITFLDTPGHEAFTEMRRRGANVTDVAVLIVAADDGVMPQTIEAINHAKAADVPIVVAANKIDKDGANLDRIKQQLAEHDLLCEEWGGDVPVIPISAKQNIGIDKLLENIIFRAEMLELRANPNRGARGYVVEARLDKGKGPIATVIVQNGTLKVGDYIVSGTTYGRVRSLTDDKGKNIKSAPPSMPVAVNGLAQVPAAGDLLVTVENEKMARQVIEERAARAKNEMLSDTPTANLEDAFKKLTDEKTKDIKVLIKADVQGSSEAVADAIGKLALEDIRVTVVHSGVGAISQSDVMMAEVAHADIIGFNVKPDNDAKLAAERNGIKIKLYNVIYEAIDDIQEQMQDMLAPKFVERSTGKAIVRTTFRVSGVGIVAGSYVQSGKIVRGGKAKLSRGGKVIYEGDITGLKRFKDDAKEVTIGLECGIAIGDFTDYLEDDVIECFVMEKETKDNK